MLPGEGNQHAVVVAVRVLTLAVVVAQVVSRRKTRLYGNFEHKRQLSSSPAATRTVASFYWLSRPNSSSTPTARAACLFAAALSLLEQCREYATQCRDERHDEEHQAH